MAQFENNPTYEVLRPDVAMAGSRPEPTFFGATDIGQMRENNKDQFLVAKLARSLELIQTSFGSKEDDDKREDEHPVHLLMVADGMGGHDAGEVASAVAIDTVAHYAFAEMTWMDSEAPPNKTSKTVEQGLQRAVKQSQQKLKQVASRKGLRPDLGTTLTMAYIQWPNAHIVHIGDSRADLYRDRSLVRLTKDHNLAEEMVQLKMISEKEASKSKFSNILTRALGGDGKEVKAEVHRLELQAGDKILLCTDGLCGCIDDDRIGSLLGNVTSPIFVEPCVDALIKEANSAGGPDNITAVLALF